MRRRDYTARFAGNQHVVLIVDIVNLFNAQRALGCDPDTPTTFPVLNPDLGQPSRDNLAQLQVPRQIRLGVRYEG
jgi:hypothetical protein